MPAVFFDAEHVALQSEDANAECDAKRVLVEWQAKNRTNLGVACHVPETVIFDGRRGGIDSAFESRS